MTIALSTFYAQVANLVPVATTELTAITIRQQIKKAVLEYGRDMPDKTETGDITGDGGRYYPITSLAGWVEQFSYITAIEYPAQVVSADHSPQLLAPEDWRDDYFVGDTRYLFLPNHSPSASDTIRVTYVTPYTWTVSATTVAYTIPAHGFSADDYIYQDNDNKWIAAEGVALLATHQVTAVADSDNFTAAELVVPVPTNDFFAVCDKAACLLCRIIATHYSRTSDSTIGADSVGHNTRADMFSARAKEFCRAYAEHIGLVSKGEGGDGNLPPSSDVVDFDVEPSYPGNRQYIFHGGRYR